MKHINKKICMLFAALIAVLALTGCGSKNTIDLTQYVQVNVSGADGYGCASADADDIGLEALLLSDDESDADSWVKLDMLLRIRYEIDKKDHLSNGDKVSVTVTYPDGLAEALDADITPKSGDSWTVEISDLGEPERVDVFEGMTIEYGNGNTLCANGSYTALQYTLSQTQGLSNGDTITITVSAPDGNADLESYCMDTYGRMPLTESCEYTVTGIDEFTTASILRSIRCVSKSKPSRRAVSLINRCSFFMAWKYLRAYFRRSCLMGSRMIDWGVLEFSVC